jgi:hypothetical protein
MKVLLEVVTITLLIIVGWRQPFREHAVRILPKSTTEKWGIHRQTPPAVVRPTPIPAAPVAPATPRDTRWMWDRKSLDHTQP